MKYTGLPMSCLRLSVVISLLVSQAKADFTDKSADPNALPKMPPEFHVSLFAREPTARQPRSMAFDDRGRLFVGMGSQYRKPKPEKLGDNVVMVLDTNGDGEADRTQGFATRFNAIQGLVPKMADSLTPLQVADLAMLLLSMEAPTVNDSSSAAAAKSDSETNGFHVERQRNQLRISLSGKPIVEFVFRDDKILRPYFSNARLLNGLKVTRNHPPVEGVDELDHSNLHPGIWLAFGDINGQDFWRNKAAMEHIRFVSDPTIKDGQLRFATECRLKKSDGEPLCLLTNEYTLTARPNGWLLIWSAEFRADKQTVVFGDQEEMGFGARMATAFTEKNGGVIRSSTGKQTAKKTWGQPANWCDYSGPDPDSGGIMLMASPKNFRQSWWHNRNYGAFVSNPFGRKSHEARRDEFCCDCSGHVHADYVRCHDSRPSRVQRRGRVRRVQEAPRGPAATLRSAYSVLFSHRTECGAATRPRAYVASCGSHLGGQCFQRIVRAAIRRASAGEEPIADINRAELVEEYASTDSSVVAFAIRKSAATTTFLLEQYLEQNHKRQQGDRKEGRTSWYAPAT